MKSGIALYSGDHLNEVCRDRFLIPCVYVIGFTHWPSLRRGRDFTVSPIGPLWDVEVILQV